MDFETAKEHFDYDPETGILIWRVKPGQRAKIGDVAGKINNRGYRQVGFRGKLYQAHRVIWLIVTGKWPVNDIDHKNGVRDDNRIINLREATRSENNQNMKSRTNTGVTGVSLHKKGYYIAQLHINGKHVLHKHFKNLEDAIAAVTEAKRKHHTFHPEIVTR